MTVSWSPWLNCLDFSWPLSACSRTTIPGLRKSLGPKESRSSVESGGGGWLACPDWLTCVCTPIAVILAILFIIRCLFQIYPDIWKLNSELSLTDHTGILATWETAQYKSCKMSILNTLARVSYYSSIDEHWRGMPQLARKRSFLLGLI